MSFFWIALAVACGGWLSSAAMLIAKLRAAHVPRQRFEDALRRRVIVHTRGGHSIDGILTGLYPDAVAVEHATYLRTGDPSVPLDGTQLIPWGQVTWAQELPADAGSTDT